MTVGGMGRVLSRWLGIGFLSAERQLGLRKNSREPAGVLIIVQNLPVPFDRRVWLECQALRDAGYDVSVICPKADGDPECQVLDGIHLYKYRPYPPTRTKRGFVAEYTYSFVMTTWLAAKVWRRKPVDILQTCNPPDIFWPLGLLFRLVAGARFVFDQHDLCPELYQSRFPDGAQLPYVALRLMELCTYRIANHVIATNGSYRAIAMRRGRRHGNEVTVVRTGPDLNRLRRQEPDAAFRRGRRFLVCYLGVMGPQDGVEIVVRAADWIVHGLKRMDISFTLIGTGDCFPDLVALSERLNLRDYVEFTGRVPDEVVFRALSTADVGLSPDPKNPLNDVSTMNKTMEYMAFGLPVVAFDLRETRVSAGGAGVYVEPNDVRLFAEAIVELLDDEPRRLSMAAVARSRVYQELAWHHQRALYVNVYDELLGFGPVTTNAATVDTVDTGWA
ncbi:MAG TPA: glycosyltransferase family 4 protein [Acidimicrobiales bacterium]|nr:glycosyltransferase family 4 protein [Acidimicrobiales bacterium]